MVIVSSHVVVGRNERHISYMEFKEKAFSPQGLDIDDNLMINIHDMTRDVYDAASGEETIGFFSLTGTCPSWCDESKVQDWSAYQAGEPVDKIIPNAAPKIELPNTQNQSDASAPSVQSINPSMQQPAPEIKNPILNTDDHEDEVAAREFENLMTDIPDETANPGAKVYVFGSSKGGTGKTFTAIISTYRYAKSHPNQRIALVDFDIIDGQVGISIHKMQPTLRKYYSEFQKGYADYRTMHEFTVHARSPFPQNVDFYLAPSNNAKINDDNFWLNVIKNSIENYDVVVFDTGIDYINLRPISYVYKCADKVLLITTTSIKSVNSVTKQIGRLKGLMSSKDEMGNDVFTKEDGIGDHLNIVITQMLASNEMNKPVYKSLSEKAPVIATFGVITDSVSQAEFYQRWDVFDHNNGVNKALDDIMS